MPWSISDRVSGAFVIFAESGRACARDRSLGTLAAGDLPASRAGRRSFGRDLQGTGSAPSEVRDRPGNIDRKAPGVREDLESLGVFRRLVDGRVDLPDVFRVGYGLGRRGGVRPIS